MAKRKHKMGCNLSVFARNQLRVARQTLRMPAAMAAVMGQTRAEAKKVIAQLSKQYGAHCVKKKGQKR